jgi:hypothetical protein
LDGSNAGFSMYAGREACELVFDPCGAEPSTDIENELGSFCARGAVAVVERVGDRRESSPWPLTETPDCRRAVRGTGGDEAAIRSELESDMSELLDDRRLRSACGPSRGELAWWPKRERRDGCAPVAGDARALVDVRALPDDCLAGVLLRDLLGAVAAGEDGLTAGEPIRSVRRGAGLDAADAGERRACA